MTLATFSTQRHKRPAHVVSPTTSRTGPGDLVVQPLSCVLGGGGLEGTCVVPASSLRPAIGTGNRGPFRTSVENPDETIIVFGYGASGLNAGQAADSPLGTTIHRRCRGRLEWKARKGRVRLYALSLFATPIFSEGRPVNGTPMVRGWTSQWLIAICVRAIVHLPLE